jgi:hypothetical protein
MKRSIKIRTLCRGLRCFVTAALLLSGRNLSHVPLRPSRVTAGRSRRRTHGPEAADPLVLAYMGEKLAELTAGFGVGTATDRLMIRYVRKIIALLAGRQAVQHLARLVAVGILGIARAVSMS